MEIIGENIHKNHRERLRKRFLEHPESLSKHEIMELLLFYAIPQKNTNPLAHDLIDKFGDIKGVMDAPTEELMQIKGLGEKTACFIKLVSALSELTLGEEVDKTAYFSAESLKPYLLKTLGREKYECFCVFYLNEKNMIIKREYCTQRVKDKVRADVARIHKTCILSEPKKIVIAHNHPHGDPRPSEEDDNSTKRVAEVVRFLGIEFLDHIIVGSDDIYSYFLNGRLERS